MTHHPKTGPNFIRAAAYLMFKTVYSVLILTVLLPKPSWVPVIVIETPATVAPTIMPLSKSKRSAITQFHQRHMCLIRLLLVAD